MAECHGGKDGACTRRTGLGKAGPVEMVRVNRVLHAFPKAADVKGGVEASYAEDDTAHREDADTCHARCEDGVAGAVHGSRIHYLIWAARRQATMYEATFACRCLRAEDMYVCMYVCMLN